MQKKAKVAIVVLNYLNDADTVECVQSIRELEGGPYDVVVVDNGPSLPFRRLPLSSHFFWLPASLPAPFLSDTESASGPTYKNNC